MSGSDLDALFQAATNAATAMSRPFDIPNGNKAVILPSGFSKVEFPPELPSHVKGIVTLESGDSFAEYINAYKNLDGETLLLASMADTSAMTIKAVLNYHEPISGAEPDSITVKHADHVAKFTPAFSEQYARWRKIDEKPMSQVDFAAFVEEFCRDIFDPAPATMMSVAADLEMSSGLEYKSKTNTQNGMVQLKFIETGSARTTDGAEIPKKFTLSVPIFFGEATTEIPVFLRFRAGNPLTFAIKIQDRETIEKEAFLAAVARIGANTEIKPLLGRV